MNTNAQTLSKFYTAFTALNADTMANCSAPPVGWSATSSTPVSN